MPKKKVALVGAGKTALTVLNEFRKSGSEIEACYVESKFLSPRWGDFLGLEIRNLDHILDLDRRRYEVFVSIGYQSLNRERERITESLLSSGFELSRCISPNSSIHPLSEIEQGTFVAAFSEIQAYSEVRRGTLVWGNCVVGHGSTVDSYSWLTSGAKVGGDSFVGERTFMGLNSSIGHGVSIGKDCLIAAGVSVSSAMPANSAALSSSASILPNSANRLFNLTMRD